jgi:hypothetical protein
MAIQSFTIRAVSDAALMQLLLTHGLLLLGEGAPRNAPGVIASHIGDAKLESTGVLLAGRFAFIGIDDDVFGVASTAAVIAALGDAIYTGPTLRVILGVGPMDPNPGRPTDPLGGLKYDKIKAINEECKRRIYARFGPAEEQVSRSRGYYGPAETDAMDSPTNGIPAMLDTANVAQDAILSATTTAEVEAVTVTWPAI